MVKFLSISTLLANLTILFLALFDSGFLALFYNGFFSAP
jgi:hypothetical protein